MTTRMILVGGLPGSGKTYFGARIANRAGTFLDKDVVNYPGLKARGLQGGTQARLIMGTA